MMYLDYLFTLLHFLYFVLVLLHSPFWDITIVSQNDLWLSLWALHILHQNKKWIVEIYHEEACSFSVLLFRYVQYLSKEVNKMKRGRKKDDQRRVHKEKGPNTSYQ